MPEIFKRDNQINMLTEFSGSSPKKVRPTDKQMGLGEESLTSLINSKAGNGHKVTSNK